MVRFDLAKLVSGLRSAHRLRILLQTAWRALFIAAFCLMPVATVTQAAEQTNAEKPSAAVLPATLAAENMATRAAQPNSEFAPGEILLGLRADRVVAASTMQNLPMQFAAALEPCTPAVQAGAIDSAAANAEQPEAVITQRILTPVGQEWDIINQLRTDPAVAYAEPNWIVQAADWPAETTQNDVVNQGSSTLLPPSLVEASVETPFLVNDKYYDQQWYMQRINASRAWALAQAAGVTASTSTSIRVAIIDSGIDASHPDLQGKVAESQNYVTPGADADDDYGHGTHVAGLIGATMNNGIGIAGPALNITYDARKVLDSAGRGFISDVAQGIKDATDAGAQIINLSLQIDSNSSTLYNCIKYAYANGALLVAASGNFSSLRVQWPAAYDEVLAVSATGYDDTPAGYNSIGCQLSANPGTRCGVEIAAPGGSAAYYLASTWPSDVNCSSPISDNPIPKDYCNRQGTSMAAAVVSGVAALVWSIQPSLTAQELRALLKQTATPIPGAADATGAGRLDALAAVRLALPGDFQVTHDHADEPLQPGAAPFTTTIRMDNSSLAAATWQATVTATPWLTPTAKLNGTVRYGSPASITLAISPTHLATGHYNAPIQLVATLANAERITKTVNIGLTIGEKFSQYYFPTVLYESPSRPVANTRVGFTWETDSLNNRITFGTFNSSQYVTLPFTMTLKGAQVVNDGRLYANGFLELPNMSHNLVLSSTACLPTPAWATTEAGNELWWPQQAIFGWWADLDTTVQGAQVSTFQPGSNRVVFEFSDVEIVDSGEKVSFQIVLFNSGRIELNYLRTPSTLLANAPATVGVSLQDSRFYNVVGCKDATHEIGILPQSGQSLVFQPADIY